MRVRGPAVICCIVTGDAYATADLVASDNHRSRAIQHQHPIKLEMANDHRYISKKGMSDSQHLLDVGRSGHHDVATNLVIGQVG